MPRWRAEYFDRANRETPERSVIIASDEVAFRRFLTFQAIGPKSFLYVCDTEVAQMIHGSESRDHCCVFRSVRNIAAKNTNVSPGAILRGSHQ